jgi:hypothetical protein
MHAGLLLEYMSVLKCRTNLDDGTVIGFF